MQGYAQTLRDFGAVKALYKRRLALPARLVDPYGWGTWTRTKNNGTRNRRVANYTIPQWFDRGRTKGQV